MDRNKLAGKKIFRDIQTKVAKEDEAEKSFAYCDLYCDDGNYCTDHHDTS